MSDDKVYSINESAKQRTHIDNETYLAMYDASINDPETFWKSQSDAFLQWDTPWTKLQQTDFAQGQAAWFLGGELNVSVNCIDRHLANRANQTAIIWEGDDPSEDAAITYAQLHEHVCRLSNVLKARA